MEYVLFESEVWKLRRRDHFGDSTLWFVSAIGTKAIWDRWVSADKCTPLDPALNILFERKEDE